MIDDRQLRVSREELDTLLAGGDRPTLIDVRDRDEFAAGHIPGSKNIPLTELAPLFDDPDSAQPMIFICESGLRSLQAAHFASIAGLRDARSLDGGMADWRNEIAGQ